jgi:hypothetical protein
MSMRIYNDGIGGASAFQPASGETGVQTGSTTRAGSTRYSGADQVEISSLSGNVAAATAALASQQAARVSRLAALYGRGEYQVNSMQLSRALVSNALSNSSVDGDT